MNKVFYALLVISISLAGCKTEGCTDLDAVNWNPDADTSDGSCVFEGQAVLWYGEEVSIFKGSIGTVAYTFYSDGQLVGSQAVSTYWNGAPNCGQDASITITKDLGSNTSMNTTYQVIDDLGFTIWSGYINFQANTCIALELTL